MVVRKELLMVATSVLLMELEIEMSLLMEFHLIVPKKQSISTD